MAIFGPPRRIGRGGPKLRAQSLTFAPPVYTARVPQVTAAPRASQIGAVDFIPNLLITTLAIVAAALPPGKQLSDSAPQARQILAADESQHPLTLGFNPQPQVRQLDTSAPPPKAAVYIDEPLQRPLTLGMNPQPQVRQLSDSAPPPKPPVTIDQPLFHPLTLGMNPQPLTRQLDASAPAAASVKLDTFPNLLATTLKPVSTAAPFIPSDTSQLQTKYEVSADVQVNVLVRGFNPQPQVRQLDTSATAPKASVAVDVYPNLLSSTLKPAGTAPVRPVDTSQLITRYAVEVDAVPNLLTSTLFVPPAPLVLPLGLPVDASQFMPKFAVQADAYPNVLVLGYPAPPPPEPPVPPAAGGLLPGDLGTGLGPYKRPGQVFGEQPVPSPFMGSAVDLAPLQRPVLTLKGPVPRVVEPVAPPADDTALVIFLLLEENMRGR